jgi:peptidyl-prolyl cis-trans isomerase SurA
MKRLLTLLILVSYLPDAGAQTLFTYGPHKVGRDEFLRAFDKNNPDTGDYKKQVTDYLELYTRFRLKVQWAYDARLDTLPQQRSDAEGFRRQIEQGFLTDTTVFNQLAAEAWERSRTELRLAHIYIPFRTTLAQGAAGTEMPTRQDSLQAQAMVRKVQDGLKAGESFASLALAYSADPEAKTLKGEIGYITVFTLPYAFENIVYGLKDQQVSEPVASPSGYHIFKKLGQRPARGKMRAAQILVAYDPGQGNAARESARKLADSLYQALRNGSDFNALAERFSNDQSSYALGGVLPEFGVGQYDARFEAQAFALRDSGDLSQPFETSFGFHILQKRGETPLEQDPQLGLAQYRALVLEDARNKRASDQFEAKAVSRAGYRKMKYLDQDLWYITDSLMASGKEIAAGGLKPGSTLFTLGSEKVTVGDWMAYAREKGFGTPRAGYPKLMEAFVRERAVDYYRQHLEEFDPAFAVQMKEFRDGNLLFESMERQVWNKAAVDTAGLRAYFRANETKYGWGPSADLIIVHAASRDEAESARKSILAQPAAWRDLGSQSSGRTMADSGRFELAQVTDIPAGEMRPGTCSEIRADGIDGTQRFLYVARVYPNPMPKKFDEARGQVMTDYQQVLEDRWINELKKKYPVRLNQPEWSKVLAR